MSALPVDSPIQRLDFDILWCIFKINANMFDDRRALETTLATSRVCSNWRNFMLSTSSIWAQLIDFDDRHCETVEGISELIRRSGTASLWIKIPDLFPFSLYGAKVILGIVSENWQRTQKLEVTIGTTHVDQWPLLYCPPPHLESFGIRFTQESNDFKHIFSSFFGGTAPMLRDLRFSGHRSNFSAQPSWLHQLRSLDLSVKLTVSETLEVLMLTKNLVTLRLDHTLADHTTSTLPFISLPKLMHLDLNLYGKLTIGAVLLDHMCIPPAFSLNISAHSIQLEEIGNKRTLASIMRAISSCARPHFTHHPPQQLWLTIQRSYFFLRTATHSDEPTFTFCVGMNFRSQPVFPTHTLTMLLSELALPGLSKVTSFGCEIGGVNRPVPGLTTFMASLPSVNDMTTDKLSLRHLRAWSAPKGGGTVPRIGFPALKLLKLVSFPPVHWYQARFNAVPNPVSTYVKARIARGPPISIIDFTEDTLDVLPEMPFLRKAVGLKLRWRQRGVAEIQEYICGTGAAQKIDPV